MESDNNFKKNNLYKEEIKYPCKKDNNLKKHKSIMEPNIKENELNINNKINFNNLYKSDNHILYSSK